MNKESIFRKYFCLTCAYLERDGPELICMIPATKDCVLEDWERYSDAAIDYIDEVE